MDVVQPVIEDVYPLSPPQLAIFERIQSDSSAISVRHLIYRLEKVDFAAFERSWQRLIDHHPMLRTSIQWEGLDRPVQVVLGELKVSIERLCWRHVPLEEQRSALGKFLDEDRRRPIAVDRAPLFRLTVLEITDQLALFVCSYHPLLLDGLSTVLVSADLSQLYESLRQDQVCLLIPPPRYREYISWLRGQNLQRAEDYWRRSLNDLAGATPLPLSRLEADDGFEENKLAFGSKLTTKLRKLAAKHNLKVSTLVRAGWSVVLGCHSGRSEVMFGEAVSCRPAEIKGIQRTVGLFTNTLPVRIRMPDRRDDVATWLRRLEDQETEQRQFQHTATSQILSWSGLPADQLLFECVLNLEKRPSADPLVPSARARQVGVHSIRPNGARPDHPLVVTVAPSNKSGLVLKAAMLNYRFSPGVGIHLLRDLRTVLARLISRPKPRPNDLLRVVSPLVPLQNQGSEPPLFVVHGAGGTVTGYLPLVRALGGDQPVFAFEARGSQKRDHSRVLALATYYLAALRRLYPNGPYRLAGWSAGALIAFELACQLERQGQRVSHLALIDPPLKLERKKRQTSIKKTSPLVKFARHQGVNLSESTLSRVPEGQRFSFLLKRFKKANLVAAQTTLAEFQRQVQLFNYHFEAIRSYVPQSYSGKVFIFLSEDGKKPAESNAMADWEKFAPDLEVERVAGSHQTMMRLPHVKILAEKLQECFRK
jgi:thioesterase domain-containing protein